MSDQKKRILYVITKSNFGGAQRYVFDLAIASTKAGYEVVVAAGTNGELFSRLQDHNIRTLPIPGLSRDLGLFSDVRALFSLGSLIRSFDPDILHLNSSKAGLLGSVLGRLLGVPTVLFTAHGWPVFEDRPLLWKILVYIGSYLTALLAHHTIEVSAHDHTLILPGTNHKRHVIHTAVADLTYQTRDEARAALFLPTTIDTHQTNIWLVSIAELHPNKNLGMAIDAVAEYNTTHHTKIFYTIIGGGELIDTLTEQISLRGQTDYITLLGHKTDAYQYVLAFDIFLLPSKKEGLPYALLEAGRAGLPCIASAVGGIPEVITTGVCGLLIEPTQPQSLIAALDALIANPDLRTRLATNLETRIATNYTQATMISATHTYYTR